MNKIFILLSTFLILLFSACTVKDFSYIEKNRDSNSTVKKVDNISYEKDVIFEWKIAKGDRIEVQAFNQSSSSSSGQLTQLLSNGGSTQAVSTRYGDEGTLITESGMVNLPLVGSIKVAGLTEEQASKLLIEEYKKYLKNPYVSVRILNQKLFVVGEVKKPGVVLVTNGTMSLFEALAQTGDLTDYANRTNIKILRGSMRDPEIREVDLTDFKAVQYASLILRPNDIVYVEPRESKASAVGYDEELPLWRLVGSALSPFTSAIITYGVATK